VGRSRSLRFGDRRQVERLVADGAQGACRPEGYGNRSWCRWPGCGGRCSRKAI